MTLDELLAGYLSEDLAPTDLADLEKRLSNDPASRARLAELCRRELALRDVLSAPAAVRPLRRRRSFDRRPASGWLPALVAAGLAVAFVAIVASTATRRETPAPPVVIAERTPEPPAPPPTPELPRPRVAPPAPQPPPSPVVEPERRTPPPIPEPVKPALPPAPPPRTTIVEATPPPALRVERAKAAGELRTGDRLPYGRPVETGPEGSCILVLEDGTRIEVGANSRLADTADGRFTLASGTLSARVARQPAGRTMVFATPNAEARVLGTALRLSVEGDATRLDVTEGKVALVRGSDRKSVDVAAGQFAVAAPGAELAARPVEAFTLKDIPAAGLALWLRADAGTTLSGGSVMIWADQSPGRRDAAQPEPSRRPQLVRYGLAGRPVLRFDGGDDFMTTAVPVEGLSGLTLVLVASNSQDRTGGPVHGQNAALFWPETEPWGWVYLTPFQTSVKFRFGTTQARNLPAFARPSIGAAFTISTAVKDGTVDSLYAQGALAARETGRKPAIRGTQGTLQIGRGGDDTGYPGDIAEILVYTRALSDAERQRVERALGAKYFRR